MTETALATSSPSAMMENVLINGDLSGLSHEQRVSYYMKVCDSIGLNPLTKPFDYLVLDGKTVLYAKKDATDQLRQSRNVSIIGLDKERIDDVYVVTAHAQTPDGRTDTSTGVVSLVKEDGEWQQASSGKRYFKGNGNWQPLRGDTLANAIETIPDARPFTEPTPIVEKAPAQSTRLQPIPPALGTMDGHGETSSPEWEATAYDPTNGKRGVKIGKHEYPMTWAKMLAGYTRCSAYEIDGILQQERPAGDRSPEDVVSLIDYHLDHKETK